jgi:hypothetical protein
MRSLTGNILPAARLASCLLQAGGQAGRRTKKIEVNEAWILETGDWRPGNEAK